MTFYSKSGSSPPEPTLILWEDVADLIGLNLEALREQCRAELKTLCLRQAAKRSAS